MNFSKYKILVLIILGITLTLFFYLFFSNHQKYSKVTSKFMKNSLVKIFKQEDSSCPIVAFIAPHHLVAVDLIDEIFAKVARANEDIKIERIILISPNHFNMGDGWINVADQNWNPDNGIIEADKETIRKIKELKLGRVDNNSFEKEHGIKNELPFVKKYFPNVPVIPITIRDGFPREKSEELAKFFAESVEGNSLMILSSDFSHYLDKNISNLHDKKAISEINNFNYENIYNLDTDCVSGLYLTMKFAQLKNYNNFQLINNSNSSEIYGHNFIGENTSYVTGYFSNKTSEKNRTTVDILFAGDLMLDRYNRTVIAKRGVEYFTKDFNRIFWGQDLNILNLEGPVTDNQSVSIDTEMENPMHFKFTFDKNSTKNFFAYNRINVVNLGNNHILNFGEDGAQETVDFLKENKMDYFGSPLDEKSSYIEKNINGLKIALVNYNRFYKLGSDNTVNKIKEAKKKNDAVIVYTHWGNEYELMPSESQKNIAHNFIDSGADLIIGSHPHVVQPIEIYKNKAIFYSLGNFVFDQYFSQDVKDELIVTASFSKDKIEFILTPLFKNENGSLSLGDENKRKQLLERLVNDSSMDSEIKEQIKEGFFSLH